MKPFDRLQTWYDAARSSLWVLPALAVAAAVALGAWLTHVTVPNRGIASTIVFNGSAPGARAMLQAIAGSVITVTSLTFSLTVVTLQLASSQFSPRLLRTFTRDPVTQIVLAVFLATFAYSLTVLRRIHSQGGGLSRSIPDVAVTGGFVWALASTGCLVWFVSHLVRLIRVDHMMQAVERETLTTLRHVYPERVEDEEHEERLPQLPHDAQPVRVQRGGFVQAVSYESLVELSARHDVVLWLETAPGDHLVRGYPLAWFWPRSARPPADHESDDIAANLERRFDDAIELGFERTSQQDVGHGMRQLADIAVRSMSAGINDPTTAIHAIGHLASILREIAERRVTPHVHRDRDGVARVYVFRPSFGDYLDLACGQIRRYSAAEPDVLVALLSMLRDMSLGMQHDGPRRDRRGALVQQADAIMAAALRALVGDDADRVVAAHDDTLEWLRGRQRPTREIGATTGLD